MPTMFIHYRILLAILLTAFLFSACTHSDNGHSLFQLMDHTGVDFNNKVTDLKLDNTVLFRNFYNGGGVAIGDINNDGLADIFFTSNQGDNKLYLNKGDFQFEDITDKAGFKQ